MRAAEVKNVDETSWKLAGKLCWLWLAATRTVAAFLIHARRGLEGFGGLAGRGHRGLGMQRPLEDLRRLCRPGSGRFAGLT